MFSLFVLLGTYHAGDHSGLVGSYIPEVRENADLKNYNDQYDIALSTEHLERSFCFCIETVYSRCWSTSKNENA